MARYTFILILVACVPAALWAQADAAAPTDDRQVSWKDLAPNIASDQKQIWTAPAHMFQNGAWVPMLAVTAVAAGLVAADPVDTPYFQHTTSFHRFNSIASSNHTTLLIAIAPLSLYAVGLVRKDDHAKKTALLAGEAVADAEILTTVFKGVDRRLRPRDLPPGSKYGDTWFDGKSTSGSFPSGHTIAAFSIATVIARRYPHHRWVPYVAYGAAGLIGFSRLTLSAHFPSDVFMGAALGYSISRFAVLRQ